MAFWMCSYLQLFNVQRINNASTHDRVLTLLIALQVHNNAVTLDFPKGTVPGSSPFRL